MKAKEFVMSVPGILLNIGLGLLGSNQAEARSSIKQGKQDFEQLLESIQKGDLAAAQQALSGLQQLPPGAQGSLPVPASAGTENANAVTGTSPLPTDFSALGAALKSGSLTGAQDAYAKLQQDLQALRQQNSEFGSLDRAAQVYSVPQQLDTSGATGSASANVASIVSTLDKVSGDLGALKQALQSGNQSLSQDAVNKLLQDLRSSSLLGRNQIAAGAEALTTA
jgi:hypothetical protein